MYIQIWSILPPQHRTLSTSGSAMIRSLSVSLWFLAAKGGVFWCICYVCTYMYIRVNVRKRSHFRILLVVSKLDYHRWETLIINYWECIVCHFYLTKPTSKVNKYVMPESLTRYVARYVDNQFSFVDLLSPEGRDHREVERQIRSINF